MTNPMLTTGLNRYLCFLNRFKSKDDESRVLSNKAVHNLGLKSSVSSHKTSNNSDDSSDSTDSSKRDDELSQTRSAELSSKDSSVKSNASRRKFSTLGGKKTVKIEEEVILPSYPKISRSMSRSARLSGELDVNSSIEDSKEMEEEKCYRRESRSRSRAPSQNRAPSQQRAPSQSRSFSTMPKIDTPRGRAESRARSSSRSSSRASSRSRSSNRGGFLDNGKLTSVGLPFDSSQYTVMDGTQKTFRSDTSTRRSLHPSQSQISIQNASLS